MYPLPPIRVMTVRGASAFSLLLLLLLLLLAAAGGLVAAASGLVVLLSPSRVSVLNTT